jgi:hypothetical protein
VTEAERGMAVEAVDNRVTSDGDRNAKKPFPTASPRMSTPLLEVFGDVLLSSSPSSSSTSSSSLLFGPFAVEVVARGVGIVDGGWVILDGEAS